MLGAYWRGQWFSQMKLTLEVWKVYTILWRTCVFENYKQYLGSNNGMKQFDIGRGFYNESSGIQILISIYRILNHMKKNHKVELYITLNFM